jgi:hypothetical protein
MRPIQIWTGLPSDVPNIELIETLLKPAAKGRQQPARSVQTPFTRDGSRMPIKNRPWRKL